MKKKIVGILVCMLLISTIALPATGTINNKNSVENETSTNCPIDKGWYWSQSYTNYAPGGMPDFDYAQDNWWTIVDRGNGIAESTAVGDDIQVTEVGEPVDPSTGVVVAPGPNCDLDSSAGGDDLALRTYCHAVSLANCLWWFDSKYSNSTGYPGDRKDYFPLVEDYGVGDDHEPDNAHCLVCEVANWLNITKTIYIDLYKWAEDIEGWFKRAGLEKGFKISEYDLPTFDTISDAIKANKTVILFIQIAQVYEGDCYCVQTHFVTVAGVNSDDLKIAISDPTFDIDNPSGNDHNDPQYVSHDIYDVKLGSPCSNYPNIKFWLEDYWPAHNHDFATIGYALIIECINEPPSTPTIDGPTEGKIKIPYTFTFNSVDPDDNDVFYDISWGDGNVDKRCGPFNSGEDFKINQTYNNKGNFTIRVKAYDTYNEESDENTLEVNIPRYRSENFLWNQRIFKLFPMLERLLSLLL